MYELNKRNDYYRLKDSVEELFYVGYRAATDKDYTAKCLSAGHIASRLNMLARIPLNINTQTITTRILDRDGFRSRKGKSGQIEYIVYEYCEEEIHRNSVSK